MSNNIKWIVTLIIVGVVATAVIFVWNNKDTGSEPDNSLVGVNGSQSESEEDQDQIQEAGDNQSDSIDQQTTSQDNGSQAESGYIDYDPAQLARADNGDVILFFHASWCPTCKILDQSLTNTDFLSTGITVMKLDYDTQTELKNRYGVTSQHTLVQVDSQGNLIKSWRGSYNLSQIEQELNS